MTAYSYLQSRGLLYRIEFDLKGAFAISILTLVVYKVSGFGVCGVGCVCLSTTSIEGRGLKKDGLWVV